MEGKRQEDSQTSHHDHEKLKIKEINLKSLYLTVKKRLWIVVLITILFTFVAGLFNSRPETPMYLSSTRIIVAASSDMMGTVRVLVREPIVLNKVIEKLGLNLSAAALRSQIRVDSVDGSLVTVVSVVDSDPRLAAEIANTAVETYRQVASEVLGITSIRLLTTAEENPFPINEKSNRIVYIAFLLGMILSVGLVFLLDSLDDSIKSEREVEELLGLTMLGQVNKIKRKDYASRRLKKQKSISVRGETIGS
ncbi:YveK family protein [Bacillus sp. FJAT-28004]|uniref:YveK family protein n=1 Tax=Bacillus sp. FJAT-28004 TaxID=1679165 RepID=UPI0006B5FA89|nr:Wzz/FepE/Etk N-terminal domain-containing protein [Bacillus sp. FJAT-28004]